MAGMRTRLILGLAALAAAAGIQPAAAQREIQTIGPYTHRAADAVFPTRVGDFQRADLHQYDEKGSDVSASYNLPTPQGRVVITVYIYPAPRVGSIGGGKSKAAAQAMLCQQQFQEVNQIIASQHGGISPAEEGGALPMPGVDASLGHRTIYHYSTAFDDREQPVRSEAHLYCYVRGKWLVKYRVSTPEAVDARGPVDTFIRTGPWPGRSSPEATAERGPVSPAGG
jgi:hypothetical protein